MKVLKWAALLLMAVLGLMAGASALASAAPATQADVSYLQLLDQNGVSYPNPEAMVSYAHDLVDQLSASPQNDASVGSIVSKRLTRLSRRRGWGRLRRGAALPGVASAPCPVPDGSGRFASMTQRFVQPGLVVRSRGSSVGQIITSPPTWPICVPWRDGDMAAADASAASVRTRSRRGPGGCVATGAKPPTSCCPPRCSHAGRTPPR